MTRERETPSTWFFTSSRTDGNGGYPVCLVLEVLSFDSSSSLDRSRRQTEIPSGAAERRYFLPNFLWHGRGF